MEVFHDIWSLAKACWGKWLKIRDRDLNLLYFQLNSIISLPPQLQTWNSFRYWRYDNLYFAKTVENIVIFIPSV